MKIQVQQITRTSNKEGQTVGLFTTLKCDGVPLHFEFVDNFEVCDLTDYLLDSVLFQTECESSMKGDDVLPEDIRAKNFKLGANSFEWDLQSFDWDWEGDETEGTYEEWKVPKTEKYRVSFEFVTKDEFLVYARNFKIGVTKNNPEVFKKDVYYAARLLASGRLYIPKSMV